MLELTDAPKVQGANPKNKGAAQLHRETILENTERWSEDDSSRQAENEEGTKITKRQASLRDQGWTWSQPITVTSTATAALTNWTLDVTFDSAAMIAAGSSLLFVLHRLLDFSVLFALFYSLLSSSSFANSDRNCRDVKT